MYNIHNIFKSAVVLAMSVFAVASCAQIEEDMDNAVGYLCPPAFEVDVTVEDLLDTKALEGFTIEEPSLTDFHYVVKDKDGAVKYDEVGLWESLVMPVGAYSIEAELGTNGFDGPYFYGKTAPGAEISALEQEVPSMTIEVRNALLKVRVDADFAKDFTLNSVELKLGDAVMKTYTAEEISDWQFVPSDVEVSVRIIGENGAGVYKEYTYPLTPAKKSANDIICRQDGNNIPSITLPDQSAGAWAGRLYVTPATFENISAANQAKVVYEVSESGNWDDIKTSVAIEGQETPGLYHVVKGLENGKTYSVRARIGNLFSEEEEEQTVTVNDNIPGTTVSLVHDNNDDPNVTLSGTDATLNLNLSGVLADLNSKGLLLFSTTLKRGDDIVRTSSEAAGVMTGEASSWPYLPQGNNYALTVSHKLVESDSDYITSSEISGFVSNPPVFGITLGKSYTSYDYGVGNADNGFSKNPDKANNECKPESLYDAGVSWNISSALMSSDLYQTGRYVNVFLTQGGTPKATYTPASLSTSTSYAVGEITGLEWKQYEVSAEVSFDNVKKATETRIHHITGLPYKMTHKANEGDHPWTKVAGTINWYDTNVDLYYGVAAYPTIASPAFYIPSDINVTVIPSITRNNYLISGRLQIYLDTNNKVYDSTLESKASFTTPLSSTMKSTLNKWTICYTYAALGPRTYVYSFDIDYK